VKNIRTCLIAIVVALVLGLAIQAQADNLTIYFSNNVTTATCADGAPCDTNALSGAVTFTTTFGTVTVSVGGTGSGSPALAALKLDLSYNLTASGSNPAGGPYTIKVSENNMSASNMGWTGLLNGNQDSGGTTAFSAFADASNSLFGTGTTLFSAGPTSAASITLTGASSIPFSSNSFSLTEQVVLTAPAGSFNASGDAKLNPVPEPATMLLIGSGLIGLAGFARKKFKK